MTRKIGLVALDRSQSYFGLEPRYLISSCLFHALAPLLAVLRTAQCWIGVPLNGLFEFSAPPLMSGGFN